MIVPLTGADVDTWGENALNPDFVALDGLLAGVQTIGVTNVPVTLTSPALYTATPGPGPTQSQNRVLRFTGILTANVRITLPLPGSYIVENLTTGAFVLSFQGVTATEVIGTPQGERLEIYNDGANVRFVNLGRVGVLEHWAGISAIPAWVTACTVKPYLYADGTISNFSDFPYLGARLGATFGGNGSTTFGVPDLRGRMPLAYDGTATRITVAGCGLNGQTLGAVLDQQTVTLAAAKIPDITSRNAAQSITVYPGGNANNVVPSVPVTSAIFILSSGSYGGGGQKPIELNFNATVSNQNAFSANNDVNVTSTNTGGSAPAHPNVPPVQVTGIWVVKT